MVITVFSMVISVISVYRDTDFKGGNFIVAVVAKEIQHLKGPCVAPELCCMVLEHLLPYAPCKMFELYLKMSKLFYSEQYESCKCTVLRALKHENKIFFSFLISI